MDYYGIGTDAIVDGEALIGRAAVTLADLHPPQWLVSSVVRSVVVDFVLLVALRRRLGAKSAFFDESRNC